MHQLGLPVHLSANVPRGAGEEAVVRINDTFAELFGTTRRWWTTSRAATLDAPEYVMPVLHLGRLDGCQLAIDQVNVSYDGKVFLCCMDYDQRYVLGDLTMSSLAEAAESDAAVAIRRQLFGFDAPGPGFLCARCEWTGPMDRHQLSVATHTASTALLRPDLSVVVAR
jgi:hypothetical protein